MFFASQSTLRVVKSSLFAVFILQLLLACTPKDGGSESVAQIEATPTPTPSPILTELPVVHDPESGTVDIPEELVFDTCLANGSNSSPCLLPKNSFVYSTEYGGKNIEQKNTIEFTKITEGTLPNGWYAGDTQVTFADSALVATNIRQGLNLFGAIGSLSTSRPAACVLGDPMPSGTCSLSKDLYVYSEAYGGRSVVCGSSNGTSVAACWLQQNSKYFISRSLETVMEPCVSSDANKLVPLAGSNCRAAVDNRYYDEAYGGRSTLCTSNESTNPTACWIEDILASTKSIVSSSNFNNWCAWDAKTTSDCRVRINVDTTGQSATPESKSYGYVYKDQYGGRSNFCTKDGVGLCWLAVEKSQLDSNLKPDNIKVNISIFGIMGKFRGEGSWKSGAHRDSNAYPLAISDESGLYSGAGDKDAGLPDGYREVPLAEYDDEGTYSTSIVAVDRTGWGSLTCGVREVDSNSHDTNLPPGFTSWSIRARLADCGDKFGLSAVWDGTNKGNAGQSKWKLVVRTGDTVNGKGREVWLDENTGLLWSSLVATSVNWCKASGSNFITGNSAIEDDPSNYCDSSNYQAITGDAVSACFEGTGFTNTDSSIDNSGKGGLSQTSSLAVGWRIPTLYDYEVGEYNGIRFVLPDMGVAISSYGSFYEWTATRYYNSSDINDKTKAWVISSKIGGQGFLDRSMTARARCVGHANILN